MGESGLTARLEPATIDGLVYSSSMVILYAARHRLPIPALAPLAANVAHGWPGGPVGAVVAAWPAASLVGSYELLLWLIRTSAAAAVARRQSPAQSTDPAGRPAADLRFLPVTAAGSTGAGSAPGGSQASGALNGHSVDGAVDLGQICVPGWSRTDGADRPAGQQAADWSAPGAPVRADDGEDEVNLAAAAAYRASLEGRMPLSERKLAAMFGKTSRRWARSRMTEAQARSNTATVDSH
jgi:hypothetical protein